MAPRVHRNIGPGSPAIGNQRVQYSCLPRRLYHQVRQSSACSTDIHLLPFLGWTHSLSLFHKTLEFTQLLDKFAIILVPIHLQGARNVTADALSQLDSPSPTEWRLPLGTSNSLFSAFRAALMNMFATAESKVTPIYVSPYPDNRAWAVDALSISWDDLGLIYAIPSSSNRSPDSGKNQNVSRNDGDSHRIAGSVTAMAPTPVTTQCTNTHATTGRGTVPVHSQPSSASVQCKPDISRLLGSKERYRDISESAIYRAAVKSQHHVPCSSAI